VHTSVPTDAHYTVHTRVSVCDCIEYLVLSATGTCVCVGGEYTHIDGQADIPTMTYIFMNTHR
jgi:hypothetical protein